MAYWGVRLGQGGQFVGVAREKGFIAVGWNELGDLAWLAAATDEGAARKRLHEEYTRSYGDQGMKGSLREGQIWRFVREIRDGDVVLVPSASKMGVVHFGRVTGSYAYVAAPSDGCPFRLRHTVEWIRDASRKELPAKLGSSVNSMLAVFSLAHRAPEIRAFLAGESEAPHSSPAAVDIFDHIVQRLLDLHPKAFEEFVADYFKAIGYDAEPTSYVADGGIDVVGSLEAEGLATVLLRVQVKRSKSNVGIETVLKTRGALGIDEQGAIISLGGFTENARAEAESEGKKTITLVEGETFVEMLLDHWSDLSEDARKVLGVRPREVAPVRERFEVDAPRR